MSEPVTEPDMKPMNPQQTQAYKDVTDIGSANGWTIYTKSIQLTGSNRN